MSVSARSTHEGFILLRFIMILSSMSPLLALLAIPGNVSYLAGFEFIYIPLVMVPNIILWLKIFSSKRDEGKHHRLLGKSDNDSYHVFIYLLALLLPFYRHGIDTERELLATILVLTLIGILFWRFNLHYINLYFLICGYRVFTVHPAENADSYGEKASWTLITRRSRLPINGRIDVYRISNTIDLMRIPSKNLRS